MQLTKEKSELIGRFENLLDGIDNKGIVAALCAKIAEEHAQQQVKKCLIADVVGRSEQLKAFVDEFIEAWEDGNGGDSDLYRKAKSL